MIFSSLRVGGVYLVVTRSFNKYLITVREINKKEGKVLATRSTLGGTELRTRWYAEGTVCNWRTRGTTVDRLLADAGYTPGVLLGQVKARGHPRPDVDDGMGLGGQTVE